MAEFRMPSLGADMVEGTLLHWHVHSGDLVHRGDVVAEVDTTKAAIEVECFDDGVVGTILVPEGTTVPVGTALATIETTVETDRRTGEGGATAESGRRESDTEPGEHPRAEPAAVENGWPPRLEPASTAPARNANSPRDGDPRATPLIRQLAAEAGIDLATLHGSGPGGRIVRADVEHTISAGDHAGLHGPGAIADHEVEVSASRTTMPHQATAELQKSEAPSRPTDVARASGYARRLAAESGVDLSSIPGTGPAGAVQAKDVRAAGFDRETISPAQKSAHIQPVGEPGERASEVPERDPVAIRKLIAAAMTRSKRTVPHYYLSSTFDMDAALRWLAEKNRRAPVSARILAAALLLCATTRAAKTVSELNGHWLDDEFRPALAVHLGVVVSVRGSGIMVPTIPDADTLAPPEMMDAMRGVVTRARTARLRSSDAIPATITVTNLGDQGVDSVFGVIAAPQVAIVGFGAISDHPCAVGGLLGVRPQLTATLSADHRASDGTVGARFLTIVSELLQKPEEL
ncbi:2-oxo acid dehydrogenase subunit E2 [Nocardia sp. NPDC049190]|uniref:2-oxo acid dehydrogenase subunit E2 n=1 Tax=Nocardia sp. NPDC049190 TaxID=3155650 RepID=UPI0033C95F0C